MDDVDVSQLRRPLPSWLSWPCHTRRYRLHVRLYAVATLIRLTLPDAVSRGWWPEVLLHWLGAVVLFASGSLLGWALCLGAVAVELLTLSDQLTQTVYLGSVALAAVVCFAGDRAGRPQRMHIDLAAAVRALTVGTYFLAAFHKLNRDFIDPQVSCANGGLRLLGEHYGSALLGSLASYPAWPYVFLAVEFALVVLAIARPGLGAVFAAAMHLPLTIIFAPAFAFTMASGWVCLVGEAELEHLRASWGRHKRAIILLAAIPIALSLGLPPYERWRTDADWCVKEAVLWGVLSWLVVAWFTRPAGYAAWLGSWRELAGRRRAQCITGCVAALWLGNGLTPYLGVQFQHTGAMLSNLRIDAGCYNHLLIPERVRIREEYIRVDQLTLATPTPDHLQDWRARLYNSEILLKDARRWCRRSPDGVRIAGRYGSAPFVVKNACEPRVLQGHQGWPFSAPLFPRFRRFQRNLDQSCLQACVH